jgi:hypothetical protein
MPPTIFYGTLTFWHRPWLWKHMARFMQDFPTTLGDHFCISLKISYWAMEVIRYDFLSLLWLRTMSHVVTCTYMCHDSFSLSVHTRCQNYVVVWSRARLIFIFSQFRTAVSCASVKELHVLKQCCNPLNVSNSTSSTEHLRPALDCMIKKMPSIQKE